MDPEELEFLGEKVITSVIPNFTHDALHLICGTFGPFRAGIPVNVPLWLASHLRKQQKCRYVPPHWMDVDTLETIKEAEKGSQSFTKMPSDHYMVETKLIIGETPEDVPRSEEIRTMIKDIFDIRMSKYRAFMDTYVRGESTQIKLDNLTAFEVHSCTPVFTHALDLIGRLKQVRRRRRIEKIRTVWTVVCDPDSLLFFRNPTQPLITAKQTGPGRIVFVAPPRNASTSPRPTPAPCLVQRTISRRQELRREILYIQIQLSLPWKFIHVDQVSI